MRGFVGLLALNPCRLKRMKDAKHIFRQEKMTFNKQFFRYVFLILSACISLPMMAQVHPSGSILDSVMVAKKIRICIWPEYYGITFRNPKTQILSGIDADLALELGKDLGVSVEFVDTNFAALVKDISAKKCDVAMFAVGITPERSERLRFTRPTLVSDIYAITTRTNRQVSRWEDIDQPGVVVVVMKGTLHETVMRQRLKEATLKIVATPMAREQEVLSGRADVFMTDYPYSRRMLETTDWARLISPPTVFHETPYAYAMMHGDERWAARVDRFVDDIYADGRLYKTAVRYKLDKLVVKR